MRNLGEQRLVGLVAACGAALALVVACSSDDSAGIDNTTGGSSGSGGRSSTGGTSAGGKTGSSGSGGGTSSGGTSSGGTSSGGSSAGGSETGGGGAASGGGGAASGGGGAANGGGGAANGGSAGKGGSGGTGGGVVGAAGDGEAGAGEAGAPGFTPVAITLLNPGFELDNGNVPPTSWVRSGFVAASYVGWDEPSAHSGHNRLALWTNAQDYTVDTSQTVAGLDNGTYVLSAWVEGATTGENSLYLYGTGYNTASPTDQVKTNIAPTGSYVQYSVTGINVTSGTLKFGVYIDATSNTWVNLDDFTLTRVE